MAKVSICDKCNQSKAYLQDLSILIGSSQDASGSSSGDYAVIDLCAECAAKILKRVSSGYDYELNQLIVRESQA